MSQFDKQWQEIAKEIMEKGMMQKPENVRARYESDNTPAPAKYVIGRQMRIPGDEFPILFNKKTYIRKAVCEIIWIWILRSNKITDLQAMNTDIWDHWVFEEGKYKDTIGPAYGFVLGKKCRRYPCDKIKWTKISRDDYQIEFDIEKNEYFVMIDQVDYVIQEIINNKSSRRIVATVWDIELLDDMFLEPCVHTTEWFVDEEDYLHLIIIARSQDFPVGTVFNVPQYRALQQVMALITGKKVGDIIPQLGHVHIYDRHFENVQKMIANDCSDKRAQLIIDPSVKKLQDFTWDKCTLIGYKDEHYDPLKFEIAK